jgi:hypothetical protein
MQKRRRVVDHASCHGYLYLANLLAGASNLKTSGCFFLQDTHPGRGVSFGEAPQTSHSIQVNWDMKCKIFILIFFPSSAS